MNIVSYNLGDLTGSISSLTVHLFTIQKRGYSTTNYLQYSVDGSPLKNTNLRPSQNLGQTQSGSFDLYANGVNTISKLKTLTLSFTNIGGATIHFDRLSLNIQTQPEVALYRWSSLDVTDSQNVPVGNVGVTPTNLGTGAAAFYLGQTGPVATPPQAILTYLGKTASNYNRTATNGMVKIPLLSDVLNSSNLRNGKAFDYNLAFSYRNANGLYVLDDSNGGISTNLAHFPNMVQNVDVRTVVFPTLAVAYGSVILSGTNVLPISGSGLYQVKGDILIKDNAKLIITNGTLKILNDLPNQFKITVSGNGSIVMDSGAITSTNSMQIFLTDNAVLSARDGSVLPGSIKVIIDGHSKVVLANDSVVAANFTAPSSSFGNLTATNVTFQSNVANFGGQATAVLTSVSIPSIVLQDQARAWSYRWLTVSVMDGTLVHGIPNAYVEVDRSVGAKYATAKTGADGNCHDQTAFGHDQFNRRTPFRQLSGKRHLLVQRPCLSEQRGHTRRLHAGRSRPIDQQWDPNSQKRHRDQRERAGSAAGAGPALLGVHIHTGSGRQSLNLTANVTNIGVVTAYNVLVRFKDLTTDSIIADSTIQSIAPGAHSNITVPWAATYPVGAHTLNVTVDPFMAIPQISRADNWNQTTISVEGVPDLSIFTNEIVVNPATPVTNSTVIDPGRYHEQRRQHGPVGRDQLL